MRRTLIVTILFLFTLSLAVPALAQMPGGKPPLPPGDGPGPGPEFDGDRPPKPPIGEDPDMVHRKLEAWKQGRDPKEVEAYMKKIGKIRNESEIYLQMSKLYMEKKEPAKALETVKKVLAIEIPDGPLADEMRRKKGHVYMMAVDAALKEGKIDEAMKFIAEAESMVKDDPMMAVNLQKKLADIHRKAGRTDDALKALEKAAELNAKIE